MRNGNPKKNIDQRLEGLVETVELLAQMHADHERDYQKRWEQNQKRWEQFEKKHQERWAQSDQRWEKRFAQMARIEERTQGMIDEVLGGIRSLTAIMREHEQRLPPSRSQAASQ